MSPHLDDAVLSLGATAAAAVRSGAQVEILTVFGYRPDSPMKSGPWDQKSGFATEGDAALVRRQEDERACSILGVTPQVLDIGAEPYERGATPDEVRAAVVAAVGAADCVLLPGFPLVHADHAELARLLLDTPLPGRLGLYAEQPYLYYERKTLKPEMRADALDPSLTSTLRWTRVPTERRDRRQKTRAVRAYRSQLWQLGLAHIGLYRMLWHEASLGGEAIAWVR